MTFSTLKPADTQKIRLGPQDIRDNFTAISTGDTSFTQDIANLAVQGADPAALAAAGRLYTKVGSGPDPDLYYRDASGLITPITEEGNLGSQTTSLYVNAISYDGGALTLTQNNFIIAHGKFDSSGVLQYGLNMVTSGTPYVSTGLFNIDVNADILINSSYIVIGNVVYSSSTNSSVRALMPRLMPAPVPATVTTIQVEVRKDGTPGRTNDFDSFFVAIIGGR